MVVGHLRADKQSLVLSYITPILAIIVVVVSLVVLVQWLSGFFQSVGASIRSVPMAPMTSILLLLIGTAFLLQRQMHAGRVLSGLIRAVSVFVLLVSSYLVLHNFISSLSTDIEGFLAAPTASASGFMTGRMSPITASLFILVSISLFISTLQRERPDRLFFMADVLTLGVFVFALIILSGYWYKSPLFYGGTIIPVALRTAIGFLLVSTAQLFNKPEDPFYRFAINPSITAQICRRILPISILVILAGGYSEEFVSGLIGPSIFPTVHVGLTLAVVAIIILIVSKVSGRVEHDITQREVALIVSETRYRRLFESAKDGILLVNAETGLIIDANPFLSDLLGCSKEDLIGKELWAIGTFKDTVANKTKFEELRQTGYVRYEDLQLKAIDGRRINVEFVSNVYDVDHQKIIQCNIRDITERKKMELELIESEKRLRATVENAPFGISTSSVDRRFLTANPSFCQILGYTESELRKMTFKEITLPEDMDKNIEQMTDLDAGWISSFSQEKRYIRKDGKVIMGRVRVSLVRDQKQNPRMYIAELEDVTEQRRVEDKYRTILATAIDGFWLVDRHGRFLEVNDSYSRMSGYSIQELLSMHISDVEAIKASVDTAAHMQKIVEQGSDSFESRHRRKDGSIFAVGISAQYRDTDGGQFVVFLRDITERKKMQAQLMAQDRLASIGQLVAGVAHEINNPLTSVVGFSELLLQRDLPDDVKGDLKIVNDEAKRAATIVKGLLTFSRKQSEGKELIDINTPVQIVMKLNAHRFAVNNIQVNTHLAEGLPQIIGNGSQLQQVFFNIVMNAEQIMLEAHGRGIITITTEQVGNIVKVSFADDGPGISTENMKKLFTPFFTTKEIGKGTGLGLSICHGIITEHGGKIYAESEPGKGATFIVELPVSKTV